MATLLIGAASRLLFKKAAKDAGKKAVKKEATKAAKKGVEKGLKKGSKTDVSESANHWWSREKKDSTQKPWWRRFLPEKDYDTVEKEHFDKLKKEDEKKMNREEKEKAKEEKQAKKQAKKQEKARKKEQARKEKDQQADADEQKKEDEKAMKKEEEEEEREKTERKTLEKAREKDRQAEADKWRKGEEERQQEYKQQALEEKERQAKAKEQEKSREKDRQAEADKWRKGEEERQQEYKQQALEEKERQAKAKEQEKAREKLRWKNLQEAEKQGKKEEKKEKKERERMQKEEGARWKAAKKVEEQLEKEEKKEKERKRKQIEEDESVESENEPSRGAGEYKSEYEDEGGESEYEPSRGAGKYKSEYGDEGGESEYELPRGAGKYKSEYEEDEEEESEDEAPRGKNRRKQANGVSKTKWVSNEDNGKNKRLRYENGQLKRDNDRLRRANFQLEQENKEKATLFRDNMSDANRIVEKGLERKRDALEREREDLERERYKIKKEWDSIEDERQRLRGKSSARSSSYSGLSEKQIKVIADKEWRKKRRNLREILRDGRSHLSERAHFVEDRIGEALNFMTGNWDREQKVTYRRVAYILFAIPLFILFVLVQAGCVFHAFRGVYIIDVFSGASDQSTSPHFRVNYFGICAINPNSNTTDSCSFALPAVFPTSSSNATAAHLQEKLFGTTIGQDTAESLLLAVNLQAIFFAIYIFIPAIAFTVGFFSSILRIRSVRSQKPITVSILTFTSGHMSAATVATSVVVEALQLVTLTSAGGFGQQVSRGPFLLALETVLKYGTLGFAIMVWFINRRATQKMMREFEAELEEYKQYFARTEDGLKGKNDPPYSDDPVPAYDGYRGDKKKYNNYMGSSPWMEDSPV